MDGTTRTVSVRIIDRETAARIVDDWSVPSCAAAPMWNMPEGSTPTWPMPGKTPSPGMILSARTLKSVILSTLLPADVRPKEELAASLTAGESDVARTAVELVVAAAASQAVGAGAAV